MIKSWLKFIYAINGLKNIINLLIKLLNFLNLNIIYF